MSPNTPNYHPEEDLVFDYQNGVDAGSIYANVGTKNILELGYISLGIAGEAGEVADEVKKLLRHNTDSEAFLHALRSRLPTILDECGDVLWYLTRMCSLYGISLRTLMILNTLKLHKRHAKIQGDTSWPLKNFSYDEGLKLMQDIESQITGVSVSISTATDTLLKRQ